jgi:uncharacterized protein YfaS (alpha-2-macroglobulin family)
MYGSAETSLIVRRSLSLTPLLPRFARYGDTFEAGVIVTAAGGLPASSPAFDANVSVMLDAASPLALRSNRTSEQVGCGCDALYEEGHS